MRAIGLLASLLCAAAIPVSSAEPALRTEIVAEGLDYPWSLAFLPDGSMLVSERGGALRMIGPEGLEPEPIDGLPPVFAVHQAGFMDVVPHPDFESNKLLYLSYVHGTAHANRTRVARAVLTGAALGEVTVIFEADPPKDTAAHNGGRMVFLPDRTLLITLGEGFDYREEAQRLDNHLGSIVRIAADGSVPEDNPFVGQSGIKPEIWSYGHRNPQGIVFDPMTGRVYQHEHGPRGGDEVNLIVKGRNYGWPVITYGLDYSGAMITPYSKRDGMEQPLVQWTPSIAPSGMTLYRGETFPDWSGDLFVSALVEQSVRRLDLEGGEIVGQEILLTELGARLRDVRTGPDGFLYVLTDEEDGKVIRVRPAE